MAIFSRGGHFTWIFIADGRKSPASLPVTDAERIALYNTGSYAGGTYKINGDKVKRRRRCGRPRCSAERSLGRERRTCPVSRQRAPAGASPLAGGFECGIGEYTAFTVRLPRVHRVAIAEAGILSVSVPSRSLRAIHAS